MLKDKHVHKIKSEYLHCETTVGVIVPNQIDKLLVLLHGYNGSFDELDKNLPLAEYANENNMLIVTPNMNNGYYICKNNYRVNEFFLFELFPKIYDTYELNDDLPMYIAGISMGGYGSLLIGTTFASGFQKMISISGALIAHDVAIGNPQVVGMPGDNEVFKYFTETFAPFDTLESDASRNPIEAIIRCKADVAPTVIMTCGTKDELYERNIDAIRQFEKYGVAHEWFSIEGGSHDFKCFDEGLRYAFKML